MDGEFHLRQSNIYYAQIMILVVRLTNEFFT